MVEQTPVILSGGLVELHRSLDIRTPQLTPELPKFLQSVWLYVSTAVRVSSVWVSQAAIDLRFTSCSSTVIWNQLYALHTRGPIFIFKTLSLLRIISLIDKIIPLSRRKLNSPGTQPKFFPY